MKSPKKAEMSALAEPATRVRGRPPAETLQASVDPAGTSFGHDFCIVRQLGQGGMGRVYLAEQLSLKRKVAIKVLRRSLAANATALVRFRAEAKTLAQLSHANVVQAYQVGEHEGRHYLVLEYVEGVSLREYLSRKGSLDVPLVLSLMRQVASALQRAEELGIIHRDIKPENILLTRKGEAKVTDFGLSRCLTLDEPMDLTRSGTAAGTPRYMSPEHIEGKAVDGRSDMYSFGITCYEMLAGKAPFNGNSAFEIALKHVREEPEPLENLRPDLPPALVAQVRKMMAKNRHGRPSPRQLLQDIGRLREALTGDNASLTAMTTVTETVPDKPPLRKRPAWRWGGLAAGALAILVTVLAIVWPRGESAAQPLPAGAV
ncbi:MAG TPA: serine/threonine-protein kinase, partial [Gemmataceae bacterium]|nr:serine/threonine-protein kinase [Gemmataceae bacterium]